MASTSVAIDVSQLQQDKRGMGFFLREFLAHLAKTKTADFEFSLVTNSKELSDKFPYPLVKPKDLKPPVMVWFPFNHPSFNTSLNYLITLHDLAPFAFPRGEKALQKKYLEGARNAKKIAVDSQFTFDEAVKFLKPPTEKMIRIYPGFEPNWPESEPFQFPWPYLLAVGPAEARKNFERLLVSFARLKKQNFPHKLAILGDLPPAKKRVGLFQVEMKNPLARLAAKLKIGEHVLFPGVVPREILARWYRNASAVIVPSLYEGFGFPVLEAYSCGVPLACSYAASLPELAGEGAFYFNPLNTDEMSSVLYHVLTDERASAQKRKHAEAQLKLFTWESCIEKYLLAFQSAARS